MNLCSNNHDEVCYETRHCPACALHDEQSNLEKEIEKRDLEINDLQSRLDAYENV